MSRVFRYTVQGFGQFPFDMLRYDSSFPEKPQDSNGMDSSIDRKRRSVTLIHNEAGRGSWEPTYARWNSFSWTVIEDGELK